MSATTITPGTLESVASQRVKVQLCSPVISIAVAGAVVVGLLVAGGSGRLPALGWVAAYLFLAVESDLRRLRIPNWLNFGSLAAALVGSAVGTEALALVQALQGTGVAFALLFPAFAFGWLGAGDVKMAMVLGALFGAGSLLSLLWWAFVVAGVMALAMVVARGELLDMLRRWALTLGSLLHGVWAPVKAAPGSAASAGLPFALALALGTLSFELWGLPWL